MVISLEDYERDKETLYVLQNSYLMRRIAESSKTKIYLLRLYAKSDIEELGLKEKIEIFEIIKTIKSNSDK